MKKLFILLLTILSLAAQAQKKIYVVKQPDNGVMLTSGVNPGDTVVFRASLNPYSWVFSNLKGDSLKKITFINEGGQAYFTNGFALHDAQNINLSGSGDKSIQYGLKINGNWKGNSAFSIDGLSKNISLDRVDTDSCSFSIFCKNEPSCDTALNKWVIRNIFITNSRFKNNQIETFYFGSTNVQKDSTTNVRPIYCNGVLKSIPTPRLGKVVIQHCEFDGSGRATIQLSHASEDTSDISYNTITHAGRQYDDQQGNGVNVGSASKVRVYNNVIKNTFCAGIASFGQYLEAFNNTIDSSSSLDGKHPANNWAPPIWLDTRMFVGYEKGHVKVYNNTTGFKGVEKDIALWDSYKKDGSGWLADNVIANNKSSITGTITTLNVGPGISYSTSLPVVVTPVPEPVPVPTETYTGRKGYWTLENKRVYYGVYKTSIGYQIKTGDYTWYKSL